MATMSRLHFPTRLGPALAGVGAVSFLALASRRWVMAWTAAQSWKDGFCSDARQLTPSERVSLERATRELDAEIGVALSERPGRKKFHERAQEAAASA
jgi:hypothetical protein